MSNRFFKQAAFAILALGGVALLVVGCGNVRAPLAPGQVSPVQQVAKGLPVDANRDMVALSPKWINPTQQSLKPTVFLKVQSPFTAASGGSFTVTMPTDSTTGVRLESATFTAAAGALAEDVTITMEGAYGATLTDIGVMFGPTGTTFNPMASLTMVVVGPVSDEDIAALTAYHIHGDSATPIPFQVQRIDDNRVVFTIGIPGFSSYSLGDDLFPPEPGP